MEMEDQEMKSRRMKRHSDNKRKMNRILNVLIAIVFALIVINVYFIVKDDGDHEVAEDTKSVQEKMTMENTRKIHRRKRIQMIL